MDAKTFDNMSQAFNKDFGAALFDLLTGDSLDKRPETQPATQALHFHDIAGDDVFKRPKI